MGFTRLQLSPLFRDKNRAWCPTAIQVAQHCSGQPQYCGKTPQKSMCKQHIGGVGFWFLSDSQTFLFVAPIQVMDPVMDICKTEWSFSTLQRAFLYSCGTTSISSRIWWFCMARSTRQLCLCPWPVPSAFTFLFNVPDGHKILLPVPGCVSKLEWGRSILALTPKHHWGCRH